MNYVLVHLMAVGCRPPVTIASAALDITVTVSLVSQSYESCLLISLGTMYAKHVAAVLYDQLYAVAFNQSHCLLLKARTSKSVSMSRWLFVRVNRLPLSPL